MQQGHDEPETYGIGSRARRQEIERFVKGAGTYVDDVHLPNQAYACFVRSIAAHAEIKSIDVDAARGLPGVIGVYTGVELADSIAQCPLTTDRVRYVGDPIGVVIAESRYQA